MRIMERLRSRWGVGPWGVLAILLAFALAGSTVVRLKRPIMGWLLPDSYPDWLGWLVYLIVIFPLYHVLLLMYGSLLGKHRFFMNRFAEIGRRLTGRRRRS